MIKFLKRYQWVAALLLIASCTSAPTPPAETRHLTAEQDAEVAAKCADGCAIVPAEIWQQIVKKLNGTAI